MLATRISDHVQEALDRLMQQYRSRPNMAALLTSLVDQIQDLEDAIYDLNDGRQLFDGSTFPAVGKQLDGIGELVGIQRNGLSDGEYLIFILGTIAEHFSDTTIPTVLTVVSLLYNTESLFFKELFPAAVAFTVNQPMLDEDLYNLAKVMVQASLGAAIAIAYIAKFINPDRLPFRFSRAGGASTPGGGFASTSDPDTGGGFAGLVYSNPDE